MEKKGHFIEKKNYISNHGRVTIPANIRKKYVLKDGDEVMFIEEEGSFRIIKLEPIEELRKKSITAHELGVLTKQLHQEELELENK